MRRVSSKVYLFFPLPPVNFNFLFLILDGNHYLEMSFMRVLKCMSKSNYSIKWKASKDQVSFYLKIFYNHICLVILPLFPVKTGSKKEFEENFKHLLIKTQQRKHELHLVTRNNLSTPISLWICLENVFLKCTIKKAFKLSFELAISIWITLYVKGLLWFSRALINMFQVKF